MRSACQRWLTRKHCGGGENERLTVQPEQTSERRLRHASSLRGTCTSTSDKSLRTASQGPDAQAVLWQSASEVDHSGKISNAHTALTCLCCCTLVLSAVSGTLLTACLHGFLHCTVACRQRVRLRMHAARALKQRWQAVHLRASPICQVCAHPASVSLRKADAPHFPPAPSAAKQKSCPCAQGQRPRALRQRPRTYNLHVWSTPSEETDMTHVQTGLFTGCCCWGSGSAPNSAARTHSHRCTHPGLQSQTHQMQQRHQEQHQQLRGKSPSLLNQYLHGPRKQASVGPN
jgi:hypothetical protein